MTCNQNDSISDLVRKIQKVLKVSFDGSVSYRIDRISMELSRVADNGNQPILVFDEAEYLSPRGLLSIKTIYDYLKGICAIVMIGTDDILNKLEKTKRKEGMPQFIRRFKAGIRHVRPIDRTFARFLEGRGYSKDLMKLLRLNATTTASWPTTSSPPSGRPTAGASRSPRSFSNRCFTFKIDDRHDQVQENGKGKFRTPQH